MNSIRIIYALVISGVLVAILISQIQVAEVINTLVRIEPPYLIAGFVLYVCSYFFRALRFHILLRGVVGMKYLFPIICVHNMVNNILPARTGELSYIYLIRRRGISTGEGITTLTIARIFDFLVISLLFFVSAIAAGQLPTVILNALWIIAFFLVIINLLLFSLAYRGEKFVGVVEGIAGRLGLNRFGIISFLLKKAYQVAKNFEIFKSKKIFVYSLLTSILVWCPPYIMTYILFEAMGLDLSLWLVVLGSTFSVISTLLPLQGLGGFGTYEGSWALAFMALGLTKKAAIVSGFGVHIVIILYFLTLGCYGLWALKLKT